MNDERYARQIMLPDFGAEGQTRLAEAKILIVGLGGLGSSAAIYLAGAGVGTIGLCDPDCVSRSNLQRQVLYSDSQIGSPKVEMAAQRLCALNPDVKVVKYNCPFDAGMASVVADFDLVLDCTDNFTTRYSIDDICARCGVPWIHGALGEFAGRVAIFNGKSGVRFVDLYPERDELCARDGVVRGVLGAVPGVIGAMQASEAVKYIVGLGQPLDGSLLTIDLLTMQTTINRI